jgi:hypothetical protein
MACLRASAYPTQSIPPWTPQDLFPAIASIWTAIREGRLTPDETSALSIVIEARFKRSSFMALQIASPLSKKPETNEMRKTVLRRLEALEKEHRSREEKEQSALEEACMYIWTTVLAYYLGGLESDKRGDVFDAHARALGYRSLYDFVEVLSEVLNKNNLDKLSEIEERYNDAYHRLFAKVGLDFDDTPLTVLFDAFITMVDQLPDQWLNRLRSDLQEWCDDPEIAVGSNVPRRLSPDNFLFMSPATRIRTKGVVSA